MKYTVRSFLPSRMQFNYLAIEANDPEDGWSNGPDEESSPHKVWQSCQFCAAAVDPCYGARSLALVSRLVPGMDYVWLPSTSLSTRRWISTSNNCSSCRYLRGCFFTWTMLEIVIQMLHLECNVHEIIQWAVQLARTIGINFWVVLSISFKVDLRTSFIATVER